MRHFTFEAQTEKAEGVLAILILYWGVLSVLKSLKGRFRWFRIGT